MHNSWKRSIEHREQYLSMVDMYYIEKASLFQRFAISLICVFTCAFTEVYNYLLLLLCIPIVVLDSSGFFRLLRFPKLWSEYSTCTREKRRLVSYQLSFFLGKICSRFKHVWRSPSSGYRDDIIYDMTLDKWFADIS